MRNNTLGWAILVTVLIAIGMAAITFYLWMDEILSSYFFA